VRNVRNVRNGERGLHNPLPPFPPCQKAFIPIHLQALEKPGPIVQEMSS
jgi:hypothetical protein